MNKYEVRKFIDKLLKGRLLSLFKMLNIHASEAIGGFSVTYDPNTDIGRSLFFTGQFEREELGLCKQYLREDSVVVDIGANIGLHSIYFSQIAHKGIVLSIEPSNPTYRLLLNNIQNIKNILPLNIAVSDVNNIVDFYEASDNAYSSLKDTKRKRIKNTKKVISFKLDDILLKLGMSRIDFVKIDVEGFEQNVIIGMQGIINKYAPYIFCEIYRGDNSNNDPEGTIKYITSLGYAAFTLKDAKLVEYAGHDDNYYNYLFIPKN